MADDARDLEGYEHPRKPIEKWGGPADHPSDLGIYPEQVMEHTTPDTWNVPATDSKGASERLIIRLPPQLVAALSALRDAPNSPYRSLHEVVRHALGRHAKWGAVSVPHVNPNAVSVLKVAIDNVKHRDMTQMSTEFAEQFGGQIKLLLSEGEDDEAAYRLWELKQALEGIEEGYVRRRNLRWCHEEFGHLIPKERPLE